MGISSLENYAVGEELARVRFLYSPLEILAEWFKAPVRNRRTLGGSVGSNPTYSNMVFQALR